MNKWNEDQFYILCKIDNKERYDNVKQQFSKMKGVNFRFTCDKPILKKFHLEEIRDDHYDYYNRYANVIDCALNHYTIIKEALYKGQEQVLIFEDDVVLHDNFTLALKKTPDDFDVIKFGSSDYCVNKDGNLEEPLFYKKRKLDLEYSTLCYALSRKGMQKYIALQDQQFKAADVQFQNMNDINYYCLNYNVCHPKNLKSTIITI